MSNASKLPTPALLLVFISFLGAFAIPELVHSAHAQGTPTVYLSPATMAFAPQNTLVDFNVSVSDMPTFGAWDIYVSAGDYSVLVPVSITEVETFGGTNQVISNCVNGVGTQCQLPGDGAGVAHLAVTTFGGSDSGNVTLFTVTFKSVSSNPNAYTFLSIPSPGMSDPNGGGIIVNSVGASYGNPASAPQAIFTWTPAQPYVGDIVTLNASASFDPQGSPIRTYQWSCSPTCANASIVNLQFKSPKDTAVTLTVYTGKGLRSFATEHIIHIKERFQIDLEMYTISASGYYNIPLGTQVAVTASVYNNGTTPVQAFNVTFKVDQDVLGIGVYNYSLHGNFTSYSYAGLGPFTWDTSKVSPGSYTLSATLSIIQGDNNTRDKFAAVDVTVQEPLGPTAVLLTTGQLGGVSVLALIVIGYAAYVLSRRRDRRRRLLQEAL